MSFTENEDKFIKELISRSGAIEFANALVDTLREIANCTKTSTTCKNETCHVAHAIEWGISEHVFPARIANKIKKDRALIKKE